MDEITIETAAPEDAVSAVLTHLNKGQIEDATSCFAQQFTFQDHGIGLEFKDKQRLTEFFQKRRELYPDTVVQSDRVLVRDDYVIMEWTLQGTITEPYYPGLSWKIPIAVHGASIVRTEVGKITEWLNYYDGLTSRRTALASYFTEWIEL
jgi:hypothetical protein